MVLMMIFDSLFILIGIYMYLLQFEMDEFGQVVVISECEIQPQLGDVLVGPVGPQDRDDRVDDEHIVELEVCLVDDGHQVPECLGLRLVEGEQGLAFVVMRVHGVKHIDNV